MPFALSLLVFFAVGASASGANLVFVEVVPDDSPLVGKTVDVEQTDRRHSFHAPSGPAPVRYQVRYISQTQDLLNQFGHPSDKGAKFSAKRMSPRDAVEQWSQPKEKNRFGIGFVGVFFYKYWVSDDRKDSIYCEATYLPGEKEYSLMKGSERCATYRATDGDELGEFVPPSRRL